MSRWAERFTAWRDKPGSRLAGTAYMPEAAERDPAAFELFGELAWRERPVDRAASNSFSGHPLAIASGG